MTYQRPLRIVSLTTAIVCSLWFQPSLLDPFNIPKLAILVVGALTLVGLLAGYAKQWWNKDEWPVLGAAALFILCMTAAGIAGPQSSYRVLWGAWARNTGLLAYLTLVILLVTSALAFRGRDARLVLWALIGVGTLNAIYGLIQVTGNDPIKWNNSYNPIIGTVGNPDFAAALMGLSVVACGWVVFDRAFSHALRISMAVLGVFILYIVDRSDALQGLIVAAIGLFVLMAAWLTTQERAKVRVLVWPWLGLGALGGLTALLGIMQIGPGTKYFFKASVLYRSDYYAAAIEMMKKKPVLGVGLDSYGDWFRLVRSPIQVARRGPDIVSNAAHNVVLQIGATAGVVTLLAYLLLSAVVAWRGAVALRNPATRMLAAGLSGAWLAFWMQSLVSIDQLGLTVWGWVLGGAVVAVSLPGVPAKVAAAKNRRAASQAGAPHMLALGVACVLGFAGVALVSTPLNEDSKVKLVSSYSFDKNNQQQLQAVTAAVQDAAAGASDPYWRSQLIAALYNYSAIDAGINLAIQSTKDFPADVTLWQLAATAYEQTNRKAEAVPFRQETVKLDPLNDNYKKLLAEDQAAK